MEGEGKEEWGRAQSRGKKEERGVEGHGGYGWAGRDGKGRGRERRGRARKATPLLPESMLHIQC